MSTASRGQLPAGLRPPYATRLETLPGPIESLPDDCEGVARDLADSDQAFGLTERCPDDQSFSDAVDQTRDPPASKTPPLEDALYLADELRHCLDREP